ncbi:LLM class F420-dependent oxidoreductase [Actinomadura viridis]|uniref:F420-dependent oxidoreductase n=1 Tax=Actinomadura viridis TaxID=58110 RepID=A0A931DCC2_9ACTN|nr:LLM class F420-dependent oxidoreductase [Actinomadura viridis]MBG6088499.1 putative F420-dependent oxidoreductase [Actinomadura viridis]
MKFGVSTFMTDEGLGPAELARALEERGLDSLFVAEHTHIPVSAANLPDDDLPPRDYYRAADPFVTLAVAATVTERLIVGTGIALAVQRDPITLAKQAATLDQVSGGRFQLGVGAGWIREEMRNHGTDPRTRMALMRERMLAVKEIWTNERAEFHGEFVDFDPIFSWPKPVQSPHLPILVGGNGPTVFDRVLEYGDGWAPNLLGTPEELLDQVAELQKRAAERGRGPIPVTLIGARLDERELAKLAEGGIRHCTFYRDAAAPEAEALRYLDKVVALTEKFRDH